jgi:hypothetical protein
MYDNKDMDIQSASVNLSQARLQEDAAVLVQAKALNTVKEQAAALEKLISSAQPVTDPNLGQKVNIIV